MEVKDKLKPYLGTNTILIIDSEEDWLLLYKYIGNGWSSTRYKETSDLCIKLNSDNYADLNYMKKSYNSYNFIHSKDLLNTTRKYNLWKLKLTT